MIVGIGTDIVEIKRIKKIFYKYGDKFKKRCFTKDEIRVEVDGVIYMQVFDSAKASAREFLLAEDADDADRTRLRRTRAGLFMCASRHMLLNQLPDFIVSRRFFLENL